MPLLTGLTLPDGSSYEMDYQGGGVELRLPDGGKPGRCRGTSFADFDRLGHYRESTTTGNFTAAAESRTVVTSYNPGSGTLLLDPEDSSPLSGNDFVMPVKSKIPTELLDKTVEEALVKGEPSVRKLLTDKRFNQ